MDAEPEPEPVHNDEVIQIQEQYVQSSPLGCGWFLLLVVSIYMGVLGIVFDQQEYQEVSRVCDEVVKFLVACVSPILDITKKLL